MKNIVFLLLIFSSFSTIAQKLQTNTDPSVSKTEGTIIYERITHWAKIIDRLSYMSKEEKDRVKMTWGANDDGWKQNFNLYFNPKESLYTYGEDNVEETNGYSWRKEELILHRNFEMDKKTDIIEMLGKTYIIEDSLHTPNWKIMNQLKDINGYICMKAVTEDTIKKQKIEAWFAQDIPVQLGPERYFGLPGAILELDINEGDVVITAKKIEFKKVEKELKLPKSKGKKIKDTDHDKLVAEHIKDSIKSYRNPYWALRY